MLVSSAEIVGSRLKRWKTKPICERRRLVRCGSRAREVLALDEQRAGGRRGQAAEDIEERGLARARRANDGDELARLDVEGDVAQGFDLELAGAIGLAEVLGRDDGRRPERGRPVHWKSVSVSS
jgi:hypothetical protein